MKLFNLQEMATASGGEYVLGMKDLHSDACYLVYGILLPGEDGRLIQPGRGYEEILCAVGGDVLIHGKHGETLLAFGHAVHVDELESFHLSNPGDRPAVYVVAGGPRKGNV